MLFPINDDGEVEELLLRAEEAGAVVVAGELLLLLLANLSLFLFLLWTGLNL